MAFQHAADSPKTADMANSWGDSLERARVAAEADNYILAMREMIAGLQTQAFDWFSEHGYQFIRSVPESSAQFHIAIAMTARDTLAELGDNPPAELETAKMALEAIAHVTDTLDDIANRRGVLRVQVNKLMVMSIALGTVQTLVSLMREGHFDKIAQLDLDRERRRIGAFKTNEKLATQKTKALSAALAILEKNATLSAEELAIKVRERAGISTTIRTLGDWIRGWRRSGDLPEPKAAK